MESKHTKKPLQQPLHLQKFFRFATVTLFPYTTLFRSRRSTWFSFFFLVLVWLVLFYCSDFIRLMRKIVFVFQIFRLGFVFLFWLWYVLVCNRWDREAWESEERKRKGIRQKELFFYSIGYYFKGEYCLEVLQ